MSNTEILNNTIPSIVANITSVMRSREDKKRLWASYKKENTLQVNEHLSNFRCAMPLRELCWHIFHSHQNHEAYMRRRSNKLPLETNS